MEELSHALTVQNLTKRYPGSTAPVDSLVDVSFEVPVGQICCLLGPNGSGKTTLLKVLAGLLQPTSGTFSINGVDPVKNPLEARSQTGWMPAEERSGFYGRLSGRQNLNFFGALHGIEPKEITRTIGNLALQIGINEELDKQILKLSSGARQKIALARALLHNPPVLLLDEPTRNLDPHTLLRFRRLLRDHLARNQKKTILLSTHQLEEARRTADHILIIHKGRVVKALGNHELETALKSTTLEDFYLKTVDAVEKPE